MAVSNLNGIAFTGISAILGITRSSLSAIGGQTITAGGGGIAEVGSGSQRLTMTTLNGGDSQNGAFPANVTANNLLVVGGAYWKGGTIDSIAVSDTRSTSYTVLLGSQVGGAWRPFIAYGIAPSSGACTVTVDPDGASLYGSCAIDEFSGVNTGSPVDATVQTATGSSTTPSVSITTATSGALLLGVVSGENVSAGGLTPGSGFTQIGELEDTNNFWSFNTEFQIVTSATSYNVDWAKAASANWSAMTVAFKAA